MYTFKVVQMTEVNTLQYSTQSEAAPASKLHQFNNDKEMLWKQYTGCSYLWMSNCLFSFPLSFSLSSIHLDCDKPIVT
jgi:hypothetical protein